MDLLLPTKMPSAQNNHASPPAEFLRWVSCRPQWLLEQFWKQRLGYIEVAIRFISGNAEETTIPLGESIHLLTASNTQMNVCFQLSLLMFMCFPQCVFRMWRSLENQRVWKKRCQKPTNSKAKVWESTSFDRRLGKIFGLKENAGEAKDWDKKSLRDLAGRSSYFSWSDACARIS